MEWHRDDMAVLLEHNRTLTRRIIAAADQLNLHLITPRDPDKRGGSVMLRLPERLVAAEVVGALRSRASPPTHGDRSCACRPA